MKNGICFETIFLTMRTARNEKGKSIILVRCSRHSPFQTFRSPWAITSTPLSVVAVVVVAVVLFFFVVVFFPGRAHRTLEQPPNYDSV